MSSRNDPREDIVDLIAVLLEELHELRQIRAHLHHQDRLLHAILNTEGAIVLDLSALEADVAANTDAVASASALLDQLAAEIRNNVDDPAALNALADALAANNANLADAVVRNTPAAPTA